MKKIKLIIVLSIFSFIAFSQEKAPVALPDSTEMIAGDTITVNVIINDWCMDGHSMKVFYASQGSGGYTSFTDSTITYVSNYYFKGRETVIYRLKDLDNNLTSEDGNLFIDVSNNGRAHLDINNINAVVNSFGYNFSTFPEYENEFEVPAGSGINSIFAFTLWMGGMDENDELHLAAERYRQGGEDYYVGPVGDFYENQQLISWNKVWKINYEELEYHKQNWWKPDYEPIENIKNWPAHGDSQFGQNPNLAPFIDYDEDGNYNPYAGDVPVIRGDQGVLMIYNDELKIHSESDGQKIGAEIHATAYAYDCSQDSIFNNTLFYHFDIINRSDTAYHDFYVGNFVDFDIGNPWDDFVGCDTVLNSFFAYNGDEIDEDNNSFGDNYPGYHNYPPAQGFTFLNQEMSSFISYYNMISVMGQPYTAEEYYNSMRSMWKDGSPLTYGGNGYGGDVPVNFQFPGDPGNPDEWSEVSAENEPYDRNGMGVTGPYDFNPGDTIQLDLAIVFARDYEGDYISSVTLLKERIAQLRWYYENDSTPCGATWLGTKTPKAKQQLSVYPNPASEILTIQLPGVDIVSSYKIYNSVGQLVMEGKIQNPKIHLDIGHLSKGYYIITFNEYKNVMAEKFMKY